MDLWFITGFLYGLIAAATGIGITTLLVRFVRRCVGIQPKKAEPAFQYVEPGQQMMRAEERQKLINAERRRQGIGNDEHEMNSTL